MTFGVTCARSTPTRGRKDGIPSPDSWEHLWCLPDLTHSTLQGESRFAVPPTLTLARGTWRSFAHPRHAAARRAPPTRPSTRMGRARGRTRPILTRLRGRGLFRAQERPGARKAKPLLGGRRQVEVATGDVRPAVDHRDLDLPPVVAQHDPGAAGERPV